MRSPKLFVLAVLLATVATVATAADLPLSRVVLFSSGVGYFERDGKVQGDTTVDMTFRTSQINDILKSLVVQDLGGGTIAPVTYAPQDPLERTLSSFSLNISDNPRLSELWDRLRGSRVLVTTLGSAAEGTALGSEKQEKAVDDKVMTIEVLNLLTERGIVQFPLEKVEAIKILDPKLSADLQKALEAIDRSRATDKKPVTLTFKGQGDRQVRVGYLLETPIWKTTYRLVNDKDGLFLQGWAIVENTTDDDWNNINLSLVSGRPVSFTQDLYQPLYLQRPDVPVMVAPAASPALNAGAMERRQSMEAEELRMDAAKAVTRPSAGRGAMAAAGPAGPMAPMAAVPVPQAAYGFAQHAAAAMAEGARVGTLFQYAINQPVTIARQRSAMIPIINEKVSGEKVDVYSPNLYQNHPMTGILLKNTSKLHLMAGPITVFDGAAYGGDALIEDIAPGDERLVTYAMDLEVEVASQAKTNADQLLSARIVKGVMTLTYKNRVETTYTIKNASADKRTVILEHAIRPDWQLVQPKEADEKTRSAYRFRVPVEPGKTATFTVAEESPRATVVALTGRNTSETRLYLQQPGMSDALKAALQKLVQMQDELATLTEQRSQKEARIKEIGQEQERIRQNMRELDRASELYKQYVEKFTKQEAEFEALRTEIKDLTAKETAKQDEIANYVAGLDIQ
jgi:hypothetical protein